AEPEVRFTPSGQAVANVRLATNETWRDREPGLVAADRRHHAHEIYFARPVGWSEYIAGKGATVAAYIGLITLAPATLLYVLGVLVSPSGEAILQTAHLLPRLVLVWLLWGVGVGLPALALSSLGTSSRLVAFLWIVLWIGSEILSTAVRFVSIVVRVVAEGRTGGPDAITPRDWNAPHWSGVLSLSDNLTAAAHGILGVADATAGIPLPKAPRQLLEQLSPSHSPALACVALIALGLLSLAVLRARVRPEGAQ
ncbi:MAG: single-stranded DNA-binding protein, partial [Planctomycetales bacterium]|nr:single-stranded DNA-binding protein [Planctomycetales bacterium]